MNKFIILLSVFLVGCSAKPIYFNPEPLTSESEALSFIEQFFWEQPKKHKVSGINITKDFIAYSDGMSASTKGAGVITPINNNVELSVLNQQTIYKNLDNRMYFNSLTPKLFERRGWFIVQLSNSNGVFIKNLYSRDKKKAERFINALMHFK